MSMTTITYYDDIFTFCVILCSDASRQSDSSLPVQFHIMFLQVVLMLAAEKQIMDREVSGFALVANDHL